MFFTNRDQRPSKTVIARLAFAARVIAALDSFAMTD
jgi:hypothetical protein